MLPYPVETIERVMELMESRSNRVSVFLQAKLHFTGEPDDQLSTEFVFDLWRKWQHKLVMSESELITHLRNLRLDVYSDQDGSILVGWAHGPSQPELPPLDEARLQAALGRCRNFACVAVELGKGKNTLREYCKRDAALASRIRSAISANRRLDGLRVVGERADKSDIAARYGFPTYDAYRTAVAARKAYKAAVQARAPEAEALRLAWCRAESAKMMGR